jgi:hypothetical protein
MSEDNIKFNIVDEDKNLYSESSTPTSQPTSTDASQSSNAEKLSVKEAQQNVFEEKIKKYLENNRVKLYILTPCFASMCYTNYVYSLINTVRLFREIGIPLKIEFCKNDSLVSRARNNLIARAMTDPEATHFLFIDNDITWEPIEILKLLIADKDLVGGVYPLKQYDWKKLVNDPQNPYNSNVVQGLLKRKNDSMIKDVIKDEDMVRFNMLKYNINYLGNSLEIENNLAKVKHLATGFMMIRRPLIEKMMTAYSYTKYVDDIGFLKEEESKMAYALFDCNVEDGHYYSEDWLFCHRWSKLNGEIFIDISICLTHTGIEDYAGCYISTIV